MELLALQERLEFDIEETLLLVNYFSLSEFLIPMNKNFEDGFIGFICSILFSMDVHDSLIT